MNEKSNRNFIRRSITVFVTLFSLLILVGTANAAIIASNPAFDDAILHSWPEAAGAVLVPGAGQWGLYDATADTTLSNLAFAGAGIIILDNFNGDETFVITEATIIGAVVVDGVGSPISGFTVSEFPGPTIPLIFAAPPVPLTVSYDGLSPILAGTKLLITYDIIAGGLPSTETVEIDVVPVLVGNECAAKIAPLCEEGVCPPGEVCGVTNGACLCEPAAPPAQVCSCGDVTGRILTDEIVLDGVPDGNVNFLDVKYVLEGLVDPGTIETDCDDGQDNDGDSFVDYADTDCNADCTSPAAGSNTPLPQTAGAIG